MMKTQGRKIPAALAVVAVLLMPAICWAEIYGWIDGSGVVTYSNLPPPKGVDVTQVIHEEPVPPKVAEETARQAQVAALNDRIRLLELEMSRAQRAAVDYPAMPFAPMEAPPNSGCGPNDSDCSGVYLYTGGWWPGYGYRNGYGYGYRGRGWGWSWPNGSGRPVAPTVRSAARSGGGGGGRSVR